MQDRIKVTTRRVTRPTPPQKAARLHEDFERRLTAVARIEAALPRVRSEHQQWLQDAIDHAEHVGPVSLERYASMAEHYLSQPMPEGDELTQQAAKDAVDLFGPIRLSPER